MYSCLDQQTTAEWRRTMAPLQNQPAAGQAARKRAMGILAKAKRAELENAWAALDDRPVATPVRGDSTYSVTVLVAPLTPRAYNSPLDGRTSRSTSASPAVTPVMSTEAIGTEGFAVSIVNKRPLSVRIT